MFAWPSHVPACSVERTLNPPFSRLDITLNHKSSNVHNHICCLSIPCKTTHTFADIGEMMWSHLGWMGDFIRDTSEKSGNQITNTSGIAGCFMHPLERFIPAVKGNLKDNISIFLD